MFAESPGQRVNAGHQRFYRSFISLRTLETHELRRSRIEMYHTSELSRIKHSTPATDLSGGKASAESLTPRRSNLTVEKAVDFQSDLFSSAVALASGRSFGP